MGCPSSLRAREDRSVWMPPNVFRARTYSLTPISGPAMGSRMRAGRRCAARMHSAVWAGLLLQWEDRNPIPLHGADPELPY
jgi:hypothetical protein